jgi:hypothetical protein
MSLELMADEKPLRAVGCIESLYSGGKKLKSVKIVGLDRADSPLQDTGRSEINHSHSAQVDGLIPRVQTL